MKKIYSLPACCIIAALLNVTSLQAQDTIRVQVMTFGSAQDTSVIFPPDTFPIQKIIMNYKLRCPYTAQCGEWDYLTYTNLYKPTGEYDSVMHIAPSYVVNSSSPNSLPLMLSPSWSYSAQFEQYITYNSVISYDSAIVGSGTNALQHPFKSDQSVCLSQYLWKASELSASGLQSGNITDLKFNLAATGSGMNHLTIRIKSTVLDSITISGYENSGFTTVFDQTTSFSTPGWKSLNFTTPFNWDGVSNIAIDISFNANVPSAVNSVMGENTSFASGITLAQDDRNRFFEGSDFIDVPAAALAGLDSIITISFWARGNPAYLPENTTVFEAWDTSGFRVLNIHLPWSDLNVYWDAGNSGTSSFDRINKLATAAEYEGNWIHWTFVKNASTGWMRIYKNGVFWRQSVNNRKAMTGIAKIRIGASINNSVFYDGNIDDISIFKVELSQSTIQQWMYKRIDASHPNYSNLLFYYPFDESSNTIVADASPNNFDGTLTGIPGSSVIDGVAEFKDFENTNERPQIVFGQGVYISTIDSSLVIDSTENAAVSVIIYGDTLNPTVATDTLLAWNTYYNNYQYDANGNATDSSLVGADTTLFLLNTVYYDPPYAVLDRYELARYITPYGNGLSLGTGWLWKFDVTDYEPLLHDTVHLNAGNWQELLDLSFDIIKGTPPRDVHDVKNIWQGHIGWDVNTETTLNARNIFIPPNAANSRVKVRLTGHGADNNNCAEFCQNTCRLFVDSIQRYSRIIWRDNCSLNPLYPQGGTWIYPRANWCPGAEVETYDMELTPYVTPGDSSLLNLNLNLYSGSGGAYYVTESQLITYGAPNFTLDAAMYLVQSPSNLQVFQRRNPICNNPVITIQNTGSTTLTSLTITYGLVGGTPSVYQWAGSLDFTKTEEVQLESIAWDSPNMTFYATVSAPNGGADEYALNNTAYSTFTLPLQYENQLIFELKTNNEPFQNYYDIFDDQGTLIFHKDNLNANTYYYDTISFVQGCYYFRLYDSGEDGLNWWANPGGGAGYMRIKKASTGAVINYFNPDFGQEIYEQFTVGFSINMNEANSVNDVWVYPNPSKGKFSFDLLFDNATDADIAVFDVTGRIIQTKRFIKVWNKSVDIDLSAQPEGVYYAIVKNEKRQWMKKLIISR
jgi:hypothetical protein